MSGVSLRELARRIGVSPATLSAVENGRTRLSVTRLAAAAAALGVSVHDVLGEVPERTRPAARGPAYASASGGRWQDMDPERPPASAAGAGDRLAPASWREFGPLAADPVLAAAIASFVEVGYHGTTVRALARRAGTSVPGLYHHYRDKQEVLVRILDLTMDELHWRVRAARAEGGDGVERVRLIVEALALFHTHRRDLGFIGASEMRSLLPGDRARIARSRSRIQQMLDDEIATACAGGAITTPHPRAAGRAIATLCTGISQWYRAGGAAAPEEIAAQYGRFALDMLGVGPEVAEAG